MAMYLTMVGHRERERRSCDEVVWKFYEMETHTRTLTVQREHTVEKRIVKIMVISIEQIDVNRRC
jgi:hypothetical protein